MSRELTLDENTGVFSRAEELLQTDIWAAQKSAFGWKARAFTLDSTDGLNAPGEGLTILVLQRYLAGSLSLAYIPFAPSLAQIHRFFGDISPASAVDCIAEALKPHLRAVVFVRFDLDWRLLTPPPSSIRDLSGTPAFAAMAGHATDSGVHREASAISGDAISADAASSSLIPGITWENCGFSLSRRLRKSPSDIQPPDTVHLGLRHADESPCTDEELLAAMKSKTRYNVRLAAKKGVEIIRVTREDRNAPPELDQWYEMYRITEERNNISVHTLEYYRNLFRLTTDEQCRLYLARHEGDLLAGIIVTRIGPQARYLYGASSNIKRNLMPAYGLQWQAIRDARDEGASYYDFFGIPPFASSGHPMFGLYQFKTGFGGELIHMAGTWDRPLRPLLYRLYLAAEGLRMYYYRVFRKR